MIPVAWGVVLFAVSVARFIDVYRVGCFAILLAWVQHDFQAGQDSVTVDDD